MTVLPTQPNKRDRGQVEVMSGLGATPEHIAKHLNLSLEELHQYYSKELRLGVEEANLRVAQTFFDLATSGDHPQMTALWMKMRAKWTEAPQLSGDEEEDEETVIEEAREKLSKLLNRGS